MRSFGFRGMISPMDVQPHTPTDTPAPVTDVLPLELATTVRPTGRLLLLGQVPTLDPFLALSSYTRLWMRWAEPDRDDPEIEIAWASMDAPSSMARVIARARVPDRWGAWALFRVAQVQGVVDLFLAEPASCDGRAEVLHLLLCVDLSRCSEDFGLSVDPFPGRYQ